MALPLPLPQSFPGKILNFSPLPLQASIRIKLDQEDVAKPDIGIPFQIPLRFSGDEDTATGVGSYAITNIVRGGAELTSPFSASIRVVLDQEDVATSGIGFEQIALRFSGDEGIAAVIDGHTSTDIVGRGAELTSPFSASIRVVLDQEDVAKPGIGSKQIALRFSGDEDIATGADGHTSTDIVGDGAELLDPKGCRAATSSISIMMFTMSSFSTPPNANHE